VAKKSKPKSKVKLPKMRHPCAIPGCDQVIPVQWRFCEKHSGRARVPGFGTKHDGPKKDVLDYRLPGSYGTGKKRKSA
jgi:hypothetical protein